MGSAAIFVLPLPAHLYDVGSVIFLELDLGVERDSLISSHKQNWGGTSKAGRRVSS